MGIFALAVLCLTCHDGIQDHQQQNKAKVAISIMENPARTVLPQVSLDDVSEYQLFGGINGESETYLAQFSTSGTEISLYPAGTWNFTLNAYSSYGLILQGKVINKQINIAGTNEVVFSLSAVNSGTGAMHITLNYPEAAGITRISVNGDIASEDFTVDSDGEFVYTKETVATGNYVINFNLYCGNELRAVISELVLVRGYLTSSKTITIAGEDLKRTLSGTVNISPAPFAAIGTELTASYSGTEAVTWQWNKDDSPIGDAAESTYTPDTIGKYTVSVSAAAHESNSKTSAAVTIVNPASDVPTGGTLEEQLTWLSSNAENNGNYEIITSGDETYASSFNLSYPGKSNVIITLKSADSQRNITRSSGSEIFTVGTGVTLVLDNNIELRSSVGNGTRVNVNGGALIMNTGSVIRNGRVSVTTNGSFIMNGGRISYNQNEHSPFAGDSYTYGGGVYVNSGTFTMNGGEISGNYAFSVNSVTGCNAYAYGGGVYVTNGTFTMNDGEISGNTAISQNASHSLDAYAYGGGVCVINGTFIMNGGRIFGNKASSASYNKNTSYGGGVYVQGIFTMNGGEIYGNEATANTSGHYYPASFFSYGGGVYVDDSGRFTKTGGTIYGYTSGNSDSNVVKKFGGTVYTSSINGHAVYVNDDIRRDTTVGPEVKLSFDGTVEPPVYSW